RAVLPAPVGISIEKESLRVINPRWILSIWDGKNSHNGGVRLSREFTNGSQNSEAPSGKTARTLATSRRLTRPSRSRAGIQASGPLTSAALAVVAERSRMLLIFSMSPVRRAAAISCAMLDLILRV